MNSTGDSKQTATRNGETGCYSAPEVLKGWVPSTKCDMWSFGCLLYEVKTRRPAFKEEGRVWAYATDEGDRCIDWDGIAGATRDLLGGLLNPKEEARPSAHAVARQIVIIDNPPTSNVEELAPNTHDIPRIIVTIDDRAAPSNAIEISPAPAVVHPIVIIDNPSTVEMIVPSGQDFPRVIVTNNLPINNLEDAHPTAQRINDPSTPNGHLQEISVPHTSEPAQFETLPPEPPSAFNPPSRSLTFWRHFRTQTFPQLSNKSRLGKLKLFRRKTKDVS